MRPDLRPRRLLQRETVNQPLVTAVDWPPLLEGLAKPEQGSLALSAQVKLRVSATQLLQGRPASLRPPRRLVKLRQRRLLVSRVMAKLPAKEKQPGLRLQLGANSQHREKQPGRGSPVLSAQVKRQVMLPELSQVRLLLAANRRPPLLEAQDFLLLLARARQCSRGPGPCALSRERQVVRKYIAWRAAAITPFPIDVSRSIRRAHLLTVTIDAAVRSVNARAACDHTRLRHRIDICAFLVRLRIEVSDLKIWDHGQTHPRERERSEDSKKKRRESFHQCALASASTGLRNVGTVDLRPKPKSINPKWYAKIKCDAVSKMPAKLRPRR